MCYVFCLSTEILCIVINYFLLVYMQNRQSYVATLNPTFRFYIKIFAYVCCSVCMPCAQRNDVFQQPNSHSRVGPRHPGTLSKISVQCHSMCIHCCNSFLALPLISSFTAFSIGLLIKTNQTAPAVCSNFLTHYPSVWKCQPCDY